MMHLQIYYLASLTSMALAQIAIPANSFTCYSCVSLPPPPDKRDLKCEENVTEFDVTSNPSSTPGWNSTFVCSYHYSVKDPHWQLTRQMLERKVDDPVALALRTKERFCKDDERASKDVWRHCYCSKELCNGTPLSKIKEYGNETDDGASGSSGSIVVVVPDLFWIVVIIAASWNYA